MKRYYRAKIEKKLNQTWKLLHPPFEISEIEFNKFNNVKVSSSLEGLLADNNPIPNSVCALYRTYDNFYACFFLEN